VCLFLARAGAYALDVMLCFSVLAPVAFFGERLLGARPEGGLQVWLATVVTFSIPVWAYFTVADASRSGETLGKRATRIRVRRATGARDLSGGGTEAQSGVGRLGIGRALARTAVKLFPWELVHFAAFALADVAGEPLQLAGLIGANVLTLAFLVVCLVTGGRKSVHDLVVGTRVEAEHRAHAVAGDHNSG